MRRLLKSLLLFLLLAALAAPAATAPPIALPPPAPAGVAPVWTQVPASPAVYYAANIPGDCFGFKKHYFYYYNGAWYRARSLEGPWHPLKKLPRALLLVPAAFFKSSPAPW